MLLEQALGGDEALPRSVPPDAIRGQWPVLGGWGGGLLPAPQGAGQDPVLLCQLHKQQRRGSRERRVAPRSLALTRQRSHPAPSPGTPCPGSPGTPGRCPVPVDDDGVRGRLVAVPAALLVTAAAGGEEQSEGEVPGQPHGPPGPQGYPPPPEPPPSPFPLLGSKGGGADREGTATCPQGSRAGGVPRTGTSATWCQGTGGWGSTGDALLQPPLTGPTVPPGSEFGLCSGVPWVGSVRRGRPRPACSHGGPAPPTGSGDTAEPQGAPRGAQGPAAASLARLLEIN